MSDVPCYIPVSAVAKACKLSHKGARGLLRRAGILMRLGGHDVVGRSQLRERLTEAYEDVYTWYLTDQNVPNVPEGAQTSLPWGRS
jgi:hypothetical protein